MTGFALLNAQTQKGKASYYSKRATGSRTASGERLHHDSLTCAHRSYPFGSMLRVTNLSNGKSVDVKVTDRGPYGRGRIIDLSYGAAREIGMLSNGVALVEVKLLPGNKAPYRLDEETNIPEFEFDFTESGYSFLEQFRDEENKQPSANKGKDMTNNSKKAAEAKDGTSQKAAHAKATTQQGNGMRKSQKQTAAKQHTTIQAAKRPVHEQDKKPEDASSWRNVFEKIKGMF